MHSTSNQIVVYVICRDTDESDTADTDQEYSWGRLGVFEYSKKAIPHALVHASELVQTYGHHGGCCTCVGEAGHKLSIKRPAKLGRSYGDKNETQADMLKSYQRHTTYKAVINLNTAHDPVTINPDDAEDADSSSSGDDAGCCKLMERLHYTEGWSNMVPLPNHRPPPRWGGIFLSKRVLITRTELLTLLRTKLQMPETWMSICRLAQLNWECFGVAQLTRDVRTTVVGVNPRIPKRRDYVRLRGIEDNTALTAQVIMFIRVRGFVHAGIEVPLNLREPANTTCNESSVTLALIRWLCPNPQAAMRDAECLPLCPPPFGANHALWQYQRRQYQRRYFTDHIFSQQLHLFPGDDRAQQRESARSQSYALYDLVQVESIIKIVNCTYIDNDPNSILETITLPFR